MRACVRAQAMKPSTYQAMIVFFNNNSSRTTVIKQMLTCVRCVVRGSPCTASRRRLRRCPMGDRRSRARTGPASRARAGGASRTWAGPATSASGVVNRRTCVSSFVHISCNK